MTLVAHRSPVHVLIAQPNRDIAAGELGNPKPRIPRHHWGFLVARIPYSPPGQPECWII
jgi:hypothetical protein